MRALLDTSVVVAMERRGLDPGGFDGGAISVMTLAELALGVAMAPDPDEFAIRRHTYLAADDGFDKIDVTPATAAVYGDIAAAVRRAGRRPAVADTLIAATAIVQELPLVTQDEGFLAFAPHGLDVVLV